MAEISQGYNRRATNRQMLRLCSHPDIELRMATNNNRCWPGYEPVKGKKEHEQGSCRKKAKSKLSANEKSFRKKRSAQLDRWQKAHPNAKRKTAQHLHAPAKRNSARKSTR